MNFFAVMWLTTEDFALMMMIWKNVLPNRKQCMVKTKTPGGTK